VIAGVVAARMASTPWLEGIGPVFRAVGAQPSLQESLLPGRCCGCRRNRPGRWCWMTRRPSPRSRGHAAARQYDFDRKIIPAVFAAETIGRCGRRPLSLLCFLSQVDAANSPSQRSIWRFSGILSSRLACTASSLPGRWVTRKAVTWRADVGPREPANQYSSVHPAPR